MALQAKNYDPAKMAGAVDNEAEFAITDGTYIVGDITGRGAEVTLSGDITSTNAGVITIGNAKVTPPKTKTKAVVALADDNVVLAIAEMYDSGIFTMTPTAGKTATTPTGAEIIAGVSGYQVGTWFDFTIVNLTAATHAITLTAGATGITLVGAVVVVAASSGTWKCRIDSTSAVTIYRT